VIQALRKFFWMDERLAAALRAGYGRGHPGWDEYDLARSVMADAEHLGEPADGQTSALLLYRGAAALMIRAQLARLGIDVRPAAGNDECWARLAEHPAMASVVADTTDAERAILQRGLGPQGENQLAMLEKSARVRAAQGLHKLATALAQSIDAAEKGVRRVRIIRWARVTAGALVVAASVWFVADKAQSHPNLALNRPVTVVTPEAVPHDPEALVDGNRTNLGFHTVAAPNQHVTIDLGAIHRIRQVVVYNRSDCCQQRAVPLRLELSSDGKGFKQVSEKKEVFDRWEVAVPRMDARYVRLTDLGSTYFHLAEVEVY
jgi:hypothetical protein